MLQRPENRYTCMPLEEIKALTIPAADDAVLFLGAVNQLLPQAGIDPVLRGRKRRYRPASTWSETASATASCVVPRLDDHRDRADAHQETAAAGDLDHNAFDDESRAHGSD